MDSATLEIVGIGVTVGLAGTGGIGTLLKWSLDRNIRAMDKKIDDLAEDLAQLRAENSALREKAMTDVECAACRKDCRDDFISWMVRLDSKMDNLLMVAANANNGIGGVR